VPAGSVRPRSQLPVLPVKSGLQGGLLDPRYLGGWVVSGVRLFTQGLGHITQALSHIRAY